MRAVIYERFGQRPELTTVPDPSPLPHVPGHELAGVVAAVGREVRRFGGGERVTTPFVSACSTCPECLAGDEQVCRVQTQPGFTHRGSFAHTMDRPGAPGMTIVNRV